MTSEEAHSFLYSLERFGIKMDLRNIGAMMEYSGNPHECIKTIHVAGTNGKGSTCAAIASVLTSMGYRTGLYASPHIVSLSERIKIDGKPISDEDLTRLTEYFMPAVNELRATFFEAVTAIMFKYFAESRVDFAVVETGLGGRLDATNIVDPIVSVITGIGLDHTDILGNTVEQIAREKAGIVKPGRPAVANTDVPSVRQVFGQAAAERNSTIYFVHENSSYRILESGMEKSTFDANVLRVDYPGLTIGLGGRHQIENALTSLTALRLMANSGVKIDDSAIYKGFGQIRRHTGIRGRLEVISRDPLVILDVAHNPDGIRALLGSLSELDGKQGILLFAAMRDKDAKTMLRNLRERFGHIILTQLQIGRSLNVSELKKLAYDIKLNSSVFGNSTEALRAALNRTTGDSFLLISGSHYLAGETLPVMEKTVFDFEGF